jgi:hypothetical protein
MILITTAGKVGSAAARLSSRAGRGIKREPTSRKAS